MPNTAPPNTPAEPVAARPGLMRRIARLAFGLLLACLALALTAGGTLLLHTRAQMADEVDALPPTLVLAATVNHQQKYSQERRFTGRVESARQTVLGFELPGRIVELSVEEGQSVTAGDTLATLDRGALELRRKGQDAARRALQTDRRLAVLESRRQRRLKGEGYASGQAFDEARLRVAGLDARIEQIDAALLAIDLDLDKTVLRAPFDAVVGQVNLESGAIVSAGVPVLTVFETGRPRVRVGIPQRLASSLQEGQRLSLVVGDREVQARLMRLRSDLNARTQTVSAIFEIDDPAPATTPSNKSMTLLFGQTAQLMLTDTLEVAGFWIPLTALREGQRGLWTMTTLTPDPKDDEVFRVGTSAVEVLHLDGERAYVRGGPADGYRYVTTGLHRFSRGERVRIKMSQESS